mmetsp:Transcript_82215/g.172116  ORF Transcript_82215/g.172116 Transcript_82215/m.172116 type:complete len:208 (-) Transcript_82215:429-1052(-)
MSFGEQRLGFALPRCRRLLRPGPASPRSSRGRWPRTWRGTRRRRGRRTRRRRSCETSWRKLKRERPTICWRKLLLPSGTRRRVWRERRRNRGQETGDSSRVRANSKIGQEMIIRTGNLLSAMDRKSVREISLCPSSQVLWTPVIQAMLPTHPHMTSVLHWKRASWRKRTATPRRHFGLIGLLHHHRDPQECLAQNTGGDPGTKFRLP